MWYWTGGDSLLSNRESLSQQYQTDYVANLASKRDRPLVAVRLFRESWTFRFEISEGQIHFVFARSIMLLNEWMLQVFKRGFQLAFSFSMFNEHCSCWSASINLQVGCLSYTVCQADCLDKNWTFCESPKVWYPVNTIHNELDHIMGFISSRCLQ